MLPTKSSFIHDVGKVQKIRKRLYELWSVFMTDGLDELCEFGKDFYKYAKPSFTKNISVTGDYTNYSNDGSDATI